MGAVSFKGFNHAAEIQSSQQQNPVRDQKQKAS